MIQADEIMIGNWIADRGGKKWQIDSWECKDKVSCKSQLCEIYGHKCEGHPLTEYVEYLQPIPLTEDILVQKCGFKKHETRITTIYSLNISPFKEILRQFSITIEPGNTYVYLREGEINQPRDKDDVITLFNSDLDGKLYLHWFQNCYKIHAKKELEVNT